MRSSAPLRKAGSRPPPPTSALNTKERVTQSKRLWKEKKAEAEECDSG